MKDNPSSPALSIQGDASDHPEGVSKQALVNTKASGHPKILRNLLRDLKRWIWNVQQKHFNNKYKDQLITTTKEVNIETIEKQKKIIDFLNGDKNGL